MNAYDLLAKLKTAGVSLSILDDRLKLDAPAGVLTAVMKENIVALKPELIAMLSLPKHGSYERPFLLHGPMPDDCFFNETCFGRVIHKSGLYFCLECGCWFQEV